jgi:hypothetical protein
MAQTKRKRRPTKHRGNAAGMVESRGRTGRRPEPAAGRGRSARQTRFDHPPTWRSAFNRAGLATIMLLVMMLLVLRQPVGTALSLAIPALLIYVPVGFYTDQWIYRRRMAKKTTGKG